MTCPSGWATMARAAARVPVTATSPRSGASATTDPTMPTCAS